MAVLHSRSVATQLPHLFAVGGPPSGRSRRGGRRHVGGGSLGEFMAVPTVTRAPRPSGLADVLDVVLDKGIVIERRAPSPRSVVGGSNRARPPAFVLIAPPGGGYLPETWPAAVDRLGASGGRLVHPCPPRSPEPSRCVPPRDRV